MTELELLELLGDVKGRYVQEAQNFRSGKIRVASGGKTRGRGLRMLTAAAMVALVLGVGLVTLRYFPGGNSGQSAPGTKALGNTASGDTGDGLQAETALPEADKRTLTYYPEGEETTVDALLYRGEGYTLTVPAQGWDYAAVDFRGVSADRWSFGLNPEIHLTVLRCTAADGQVPYEFIMQAYTGYFFTIQETGELVPDLDAMSPTVYRRAKFISAGDGDGSYYVLLSEYPLEAAEGAGMLLSAMEDSFRALPPEETLETETTPADQDTLSYPNALGEIREIPARVFSGEGYSLYIPESGWTHSEFPLAGGIAQRWEYEENRNIRLSTVALGSVTLGDAQSLLTDALPEYTLEAASNGTLYSQGEGNAVEVHFRQTREGGYAALVLEFPQTGGEQYLLRAIAGSYYPTDRMNAVVNRPETRETTAYIRQQDVTWLSDLQVEEGYSLYVPRGDAWQRREAVEQGTPITYWSSADQPDCFLAVARLGSLTRAQGMTLAKNQWDYPLMEMQDGSISGDNGTDYLSIRFLEARDGLLGVIVRFPLSEFEGMQVYLESMEESIRLS